jgi:hypothetical protein
MKGKLDLFDDICSERREVDTRVLEQTVGQQALRLDTILQVRGTPSSWGGRLPLLDPQEHDV